MLISWPLSSPKRRLVAATLISVLLFGAALLQPAFFWGASAQSSGPAGRLLLKGWTGLPHGYVEWLANPLLAISWSSGFCGRRVASALAAVAALALMLVFMCRRTLTAPAVAAHVTMVYPGMGYWLWLGSAAVMIVAGRGSLLSLVRARYIEDHRISKDLP